MAKTLSEHKLVTRGEWIGNEKYQYFSNVLEYLAKKDIKFCVDVGGCTGEVSNIFIENIKSLEKVAIIEPILENYNFICDNVKSENIELITINKALFYGSKNISMGLSDHNIGGYSIKWNNSFESIPTVTIESLFKHDKIDLIKIDVEGAEKNIIENSHKLKDVKYIEIEFHDELKSPSVWKSFITKHLPNHKIVMTDEDILDSGSCCSHALLEKI